MIWYGDRLGEKHISEWVFRLDVEKASCQPFSACHELPCVWA